MSSEKGRQKEFLIEPLLNPFLGSGTLPLNLSKLLASITLNLFSKTFLLIWFISFTNSFFHAQYSWKE